MQHVYVRPYYIDLQNFAWLSLSTSPALRSRNSSSTSLSTACRSAPRQLRVTCLSARPLIVKHLSANRKRGSMRNRHLAIVLHNIMLYMTHSKRRHFLADHAREVQFPKKSSTSLIDKYLGTAHGSLLQQHTIIITELYTTGVSRQDFLEMGRLENFSVTSSTTPSLSNGIPLCRSPLQ